MTLCPAHVVVVDDDLRLASLIAKKLERHGFIVSLRNSIRGVPPDAIVLIDWSVVRDAGIPEPPSNRVIVMTGAPASTVTTTAWAGRSLLLKPFDEDQLLASVLALAAEERA